MARLSTSSYPRDQEIILRQARRKMRTACMAGLVIGISIVAVTATVVAFIPGGTTTISGKSITVFTFLYAGLFFVMSYLIWWRKSLFAAIMIFAFSLSDMIHMWYRVLLAIDMPTVGTLLRTGIGLVLLYLFFEGIRGTVMYHRIKTRGESPAAPENEQSTQDVRQEAPTIPMRVQESPRDQTRPVLGSPSKEQHPQARLSRTTLAHRARQLLAYTRQHWRGELPLVTSFWINVVLVNLGLRALERLLLNSSPIQTSLASSRLTLSYLFLSIAIVYPWQIIGCWRSANVHTQRTKRRLWARTAQFLIVLGFLGTLADHILAWPIYTALVQTALG